MFVKIASVGMFGMNSYEVGVEASIDNGLPRFDMVGLPDTAVSESRDRVRSAIKNSGFRYPDGRVTVNLTPADIKKEGPLYDLPILVALLVASGQMSCDLKESAFFGELSLSGKIRKITGALPMVIKAKELGIKLEINGARTTMSKEQLRQAVNEGADLIIGSDAHSPDRVGDDSLAYAAAEEAGVLSAVVNIK